MALKSFIDKNETMAGWYYSWSELLEEDVADSFIGVSCLGGVVMVPENWSLYQTRSFTTRSYEIVREATMLEF